jgi:hypothetical protein
VADLTPAMPFGVGIAGVKSATTCLSAGADSGVTR